MIQAGLRVLVTGGASGIGWAIALAQREQGARLHLCVEGERMRRVIAARADAEGISYDELERRYLGQVSLRRMVAPADVAALVLFLCSPAGRNMSGQSLGVCGSVESLR
jgi:NAD(P)-dependent dehydrogenase (short-subunit alcohol dehydrogenase family)